MKLSVHLAMAAVLSITHCIATPVSSAYNSIDIANVADRDVHASYDIPSLEDRGQCADISPSEAEVIVDRIITMWKREPGWKKILKSLYAKDVTGSSNSIASSRGLPISKQPIYHNRDEWLEDLAETIPKIEDQSVLGHYVDCRTIVLYRRIGRVAGSEKFVTQDIQILHFERSRKDRKLRIKKFQAEFDSVQWGRAFGGKYIPLNDKVEHRY